MRSIIFLIILCWVTSSYSQFSVDFSADTLMACPNTPISFSDLSTSSTGIVSWVWDFGDGSSSNIQNPTHSYTYSGYFTVILTIFNGTQAITEVKQNYIFIHPLPQPNFSFTPPACNAPSSISIQNTQPSTGCSYLWDFGNGQSSSAQFPSNITYNQEGSFPVSLTVTNNTTGCTNSTSQMVNIYNYETSFIQNTTTICQGSQIQFQSTSSPGTNVYNWNFGNGSSSNLSNPDVIFSDPGTYTVTLNSQNSLNNCAGSSEVLITVIASESPVFNSNITEGCNPSDITFEITNGFSGTLNWNFGNGSTYSGLNPPPINYAIPTILDGDPYLNQQFNISLISTDANGCIVTQNFPNYISIFNVFLDSVTCGVLFAGCEPLEVDLSPWAYSGSVNYPISGWYWDLGDGSTSTEEFPVNTYMHGIYTIEVTVFTSNGCSASKTETVLSGVPPNVYFELLSDTICAGTIPQIVNYTNIDPVQPLANINYTVIFSNGTEVQGPVSFPAEVELVGDITMTLIATYLGCSNSYTSPITFFAEPPLARHFVESIYCNPQLPLTVNIFNFPILGEEGDSVSMTYDFGDGTQISYSSEQAWVLVNEDIQHVYNAYGDYVLSQTVHNFRTGCTHTETTEMRIVDFKFDASPIPDSICFGSSISFSVQYFSNPNYPFISYGIELADLPFRFYEFDTVQYQTYDSVYTYIFQNSDYQNMTFYGENSLGCVATTNHSILVLSLPNVSIASSPSSGCSPLDVSFLANAASEYNLPILSYSWSHDSYPDTATSNSSQTTYSGEGTHTTLVNATDAFGCVGTGVSNIAITKPTASFEFPYVLCWESFESAVNNSIDYSNASWYLDDELVSNAMSPLIGVIDSLPNGLNCMDIILKLLVTDQNGCVDSTQQYITISAPKASFEYEFIGANMNAFADFTCPAVFANLTNTSSICGNAAAYYWSFGDGKNSVLENPSNTYVFAGTYTASLEVTDNYGCEGQLTYFDYLSIGGPSGEFEWSGPANICYPEFLFNVIELNDAVEVIWNMGNLDSISSMDSTFYSYNSSGEFYPYVTILDAANCAVTYWLDTIVLELNNLNAAFTVNPMEVIYGDPLQVFNESSGGFGGIVSNVWDFYGNTFEENSEDFFHYFDEAGQLIISLIVYDSLGCTDTARLLVIVVPDVSIPNVFTPNGDGANDVFRLINNGYKEYEVVILNRWGNVMSTTYVVDDNYLWDGKTANGDFAEEGVYFYRINGILADGNTRGEHGFFHLVKE